MSRAPHDARALYTVQLRTSLAHISKLVDASTQAEAIIAFSAMVGALSLARAVNDPALSAEVLSTVRDYLVKHFKLAT